MFRKLIVFSILLLKLNNTASQNTSCSNSKFRDLDFWIGQWDVYAQNGKLAGTSKISLILDSCVILEEWESTQLQNNFAYKGKSFNTYNIVTQQWQQTWIDNTGNTTEFLRGNSSDGKVEFFADNVPVENGKFFKRRVTFSKINSDKVRQFGERSDDNGTTWSVEYDLEYRRRQ